MSLKLLSVSLCVAISTFLLTNSTVFADPYGYGSRDRYDDYSDYHNDDSRYDDRDRREDVDRERRELEHERNKLEDERRHLEDERERATHQAAAPAPAVRETCPNGFSPSENKCSVEERRRGCKDMRLPGGLGCVHR